MTKRKRQKTIQSIILLSFLCVYVAAHKKAIERRVPLGKVDVITSKILCRHHDLVDRYGISVSQMTTDMFHLSKALPGAFLIHDLSPGLSLD
jgi:hypothetical protein